MPSELQRVTQALLEVLDEVPRIVAYLQRTADKCRENAALIGSMSTQPSTRTAASQLDHAARSCEEAAHLASIAPHRARIWVETLMQASSASPSRDPSPGVAERSAPSSDDEVRLSTKNPDHLPSLSDPRPNSSILVDDQFRYRTDESGRVVSARAVLTRIDLNHPRDTTAQRKLVGKLPGDHAGHIFARIFGGPIGTMNLVPMKGNKVNLSQYKTVENHWRRLIEQGEDVEVFVRFAYVSDAVRPHRIRLQYEWDDRAELIDIDNSPVEGAN